MKKWIALAVLPVLVACGGSDDDEIVSGTVTDDDGNETEYSVSGDGKKGDFNIKTKDGSFSLSADSGGDVKLPFGLKPFPGAEIKANVQMNQSAEGTSGSMISFETTSTPDKVIDFYTAQVKAAGFEITTEINSGETKMFNATRDEKDTVNVTATKSDDGKTMGNVIAGSKS